MSISSFSNLLHPATQSFSEKDMQEYLSERMTTGHLSSLASSLGRDHLNTKIIESGFGVAYGKVEENLNKNQQLC